MESVKIVLLCVASAVVYGILHDQVTARVCIEYFTIAHPHLFDTTSPTLLAIGWGIVATWWVGLILGILAVLVSRPGSWPKLGVAHLVRPVAILMMVTAVASLVSGIVGFHLAKSGVLVLNGWLAVRIPVSEHCRFFADWFAHLAAYGVGAVGGLAICIWALCRRCRMSWASLQSKTSR